MPPVFLTLAEVVEIHLFHIVKNHPFVDGNKRSSAVAALVFLEINDMEVALNEDELYLEAIDTESV